MGEALSIRLHAVEAAIDAALVESSTLMALLPRARAEAYLPAVTGQRVFDGAAASIAALTEARSHMVDTHNTLAALARKLGLETLAIGPLDKPEDTPPNGGGITAAFAPKVNKSLPLSPDAC
ncbi:hypothetical protein KOAAANKH_03383 [Brevundimonas sp. NIBR10]|nr:hypothetical protein KOAAANKH_03383 [Brevundimonas sp. NIBR10]